MYNSDDVSLNNNVIIIRKLQYRIMEGYGWFSAPKKSKIHFGALITFGTIDGKMIKKLILVKNPST